MQINGAGETMRQTFPVTHKPGKNVMISAEHAKATLSSRFRDLTDRLESVENSRRHRTAALSADSEERALECENDEVLDRLEEVTRQELLQIQHALDRIETGHYGICERCGTALGEARLYVLPEATCCSNCQSGNPAL